MKSIADAGINACSWGTHIPEYIHGAKICLCVFVRLRTSVVGFWRACSLISRWLSEGWGSGKTSGSARAFCDGPSSTMNPRLLAYQTMAGRSFGRASTKCSEKLRGWRVHCGDGFWRGESGSMNLHFLRRELLISLLAEPNCRRWC